ncbi:ORF6N domain-containing protein [Psychrobacillus sp. FSL K6-2365]|uniref:ORF6N domain-containing protein n=1 Tax=Psychrobacillus sp. FSL K6-2365 TaxID=2921546 RepID=UPI0030F92A69
MELQAIEQSGKRVLTTSQLAESFNVNPKIINRNFQRNKVHYEQGKHFFALTGEDLKGFKAERQEDASLKFVSVLYLWTEQGAWLHAKSLNNEKAREAYSALVDGYYNLADKMKSPEFLIAIQDEKILEMAEKINKMEKGMMTIQTQMQNQITLNSGEQRRLQKAVGERAFTLEKDSTARGQVFRGIYSAIKKQFAVKSYRDVKQHQLQKAIRFVEKWNG